MTHPPYAFVLTYAHLGRARRPWEHELYRNALVETKQAYVGQLILLLLILLI